MEILRFEDRKSSNAPGKKSPRGMFIVGLIAALFGISSAFASSTIQINGNVPIALGQGVSHVTACDESISVVPTTEMSVEVGTPTFFLKQIDITDVDTRTASAITGLGCADKTFKLQLFNNSATQYPCSALGVDSNIVTVGAGTLTASCSSDTISFTMPSTFTASNPIFHLNFNKGPAEINYITLVTTS